MYEENEQKEYRDGAVVGTEFIILYPFSKAPRIATVTKTTKTWLIVDGYTFRKSDGHQVGASSYETHTILKPTDELRAEAKHAYLVKATLSRMENTKKYLEEMTTEELGRLYSTMLGMKDAVFSRRNETTTKTK